MAVIESLVIEPLPGGTGKPTQIQALLQRLASPVPTPPLPPTILTKQEVESLASSLTRASTHQDRSLAYITLGKAFELTRTTSSDSLVSVLQATTSSLLSDTATPSPVLSAVGLLKAIIEIDGEAGKAVLAKEGKLDDITDMAELDFFSTATVDGTPSDQARVQLAIAELLNAGCNIPGLRALIKARAEGWMLTQTKRRPVARRTEVTKADGAVVSATSSDEIAVICAVALTKLERASGADPLLGETGEGNADDGQTEQATSITAGGSEEARLSEMLSGVIISSTSSGTMDTVTAAIEGLAYTSLDPAVREWLSLDKPFLASLFDLASQTPSSLTSAATIAAPRKSGLSPSYSLNLDSEDPKSTALAYGIAVILLNIVSRKPMLSEEQKQVEKLKRMANSGKAGKKLGESVGTSKEDQDNGDPLESNAAVEKRVKRILAAGVMKAIGHLSKANSNRVKEVVGKLMLELVWEKDDRIPIIQGGGAKALLAIVGTLLGEAGVGVKARASAGEQPEASLADGKVDEVSPLALSSIQALAKLIITTPPFNLFGQDYTAAALDCVRPLAHLLRNGNSSLLQRFEALMGLTNLASISPEVASKVMAQGEDFMRKVEGEMLEDHELVRRAAVELVCNLATSEEGFCRYTGEEPGALWDGASKVTDIQMTKRKAAKNRLRILLAMTDVDDLPTRLAAAGGLASLVQSQIACESLLSLDGNSSKAWDRIVMMLRPASSRDSDGEIEDVEELSTSPPDAGLVHRALVIAVDLLTYTGSLPPSEKKGILDTAVQSDLLQELLGMLASWTAQSPDSRSVPPRKELVDATVESLRLMRDGGVSLAI